MDEEVEGEGLGVGSGGLSCCDGGEGTGLRGLEGEGILGGDAQIHVCFGVCLMMWPSAVFASRRLFSRSISSDGLEDSSECMFSNDICLDVMM